jgi:two-component system, NarL family, sensor kinase
MESQIDVYLFLFVGMLTLALLAGAVVIFFFFYQKKVLRQQLQLSEMETRHREELLHRNIEQVEAERHRIATDLHDELGGIFSTLKLKINLLNNGSSPDAVMAESREIIDTGVASVRRISHSLTPPGLDMFGLVDALANLCEKANSPGFEVTFAADPDFPRMPANTELGLYRIAQELLNNSIKHAEASKTSLYLGRVDEAAYFEYADNGKGFDPALLQSRKGLGLKNIEARANYLNAVITWNTQPGKGLKTIIKVPF